MPSFAVGSVSFLSADTGWALGYTNRLTLKRTTNGGRSWLTLPFPPARSSANPVPAPPRPVVTSVAFADPRHGYLWGDSLLATDNGGRSWTTVPQVRHVGLFLIVAQHAVALTAALTGERLPLRVSAVGTTQWTTRITPARGHTTITSAGSTLVLLQKGSQQGVGRLWTSSDLGAHWSSRPLPCTIGQDWAGTIGTTFNQPSPWYLDCYNDDESQQHAATTHRLWVSPDQGRHWTRLGQPTHRGYPGVLAASGNHVLLDTVSGPGDVLSASADGGAHWADLFSDGGSFNGWEGPTFITARTAYLVGPTQYATPHLYRSDDSGAHWRTITIP
ncbi:hypothetical protein acdb102_33520 [Acidothermaceae bacterium B102]|nr:hypothetical protein acdb102_33520 [Acidothermaceae bacterium B102]